MELQPPASSNPKLESLLGRGLASKALTVSTMTALLGGAAYEWRIGYEEGIASRRGISVDFVSLPSDAGAATYVIVLLVLLLSFIAVLLATLVPAFTSWHLFGAMGLFELVRAGLAFANRSHSADRWYHLLAAGVLLAFAVTVELIARWIERILKRRRARLPQGRLRRRVRRLVLRFTKLRVTEKLDTFITAVQVVFVLALTAMAALYAAALFGQWFGRASAAPDQAVITSGQTYAWLGTTSDGLIVARSVTFCGGLRPEDARQAVIAGKRSMLLKAEGIEVIRLSNHLRLVDQCGK